MRKSLTLSLMLILICIGMFGFAPNVEAATPTLMAETYANAYTNKYILGNSTITQRRADVAIISIESTLPTTLPSGAWDVSKSTDGSVYAWLTVNATDSTKYDLHIAADGGVVASSGYYLFAYYTNCTEIQGLNKLNTSKVTDMGDMFYNCSSLTTLDVSNFDTSKVTDMSYMFYNCSSLTSLDVSNFDTSKVTNTSRMFSKCSSLTNLDVSAFNTSNVTNMSSMFDDCGSLTSLNLSNFNTSKVKTMGAMFSDCTNLMQINVSGFDFSALDHSTHHVIKMGYKCIDTAAMFYNCPSLKTLDLSTWDTSNIASMGIMFAGCTSLTSIPTGLDLSNTAITSNDKYSGYAEMFGSCRSLTSVTINSKYIGYRMFYGCNKLTDITITSDVQGVYNSGTGTPSGAFTYTGTGTLYTTLNSSSTAITEDNYDWEADKRAFKKPDTLAPTGTITLGGTYHKANGYKYVKSGVVTLNLTAADNESEQQNIKVALINEANYDRTKQNSTITWLDFSATKQWTSSSGKGLKRVYVIFRDEAGNQSVYFAQ
mgnify:CR=1 FL=1